MAGLLVYSEKGHAVLPIKGQIHMVKMLLVLALQQESFNRNVFHYLLLVW